MRSHAVRSAFIVLLMVAISRPAQALQFIEVTLHDCDSFGCQGSTLYLSVQEEASGSWIVTYRINTDNYSDSRSGLNQIGFKAIEGWTTGTVLSSPAASMTDWDPVYDDPVAANSLCDSSTADSDEVCVQGFVDITGGGDYTWTFRIDDGTLITDSFQWHLGAQYANSSFRTTGGIISASILDSDGDGLSDDNETYVYFTNPLDTDTDDDGLSDGEEVIATLTNPLLPDHDGDGVCDGGGTGSGTCSAGPDNCPFVSNASQANSDSLSAGDACQCGDVNNDSGVNGLDVQISRERLVGSALSGSFHPERCNVIGNADCGVDDIFVLERVTHGLPVTVANDCEAYSGP